MILDNKLAKNRKPILFLLASFMIAGVFFASATYQHGTELSEEAHMFMVSHTEYRSGETGQIIGKLFNFRGDPILADCNVTIYNPDKSIFLAPTPTDDTLEATDGTHYVNFTTPATEGTYEYKIFCAFTLGGNPTDRTVSNSFHLSPALNTITTVNNTVNSYVAYLVDINDTTDETNEIVKQINASTSTLLNDSNQDLLAFLVDVNNTVTDIDLNVIDINSTIVQEFATLQVNISNINVDIDYIRNNLFTDADAFNNFSVISTNFNTVFSELTNIQTNLTDLINFCDGAPTSDSQLCQWVQQNNALAIGINDTLNNVIDVKLDAINLTTATTLDFLTVNVTNNFNTVFATLSRIEAGITDINNTANRIESNVTTVIQNQEEQVFIGVFS